MKKVGEVLVEKGMITLEQLTRGLAEQKVNGASLGSSLVRLGIIDYKTLERVLAEELDKSESRKIGEILLEGRLIAPEQLSEALKIQHKSGKLLGEILIEEGFLNQQQLFDALSTQFDVKVVEPEGFLFKKDAVALLTYEEACRYKAVVLRPAGRHMVVAMNEPFNFRAIREMEEKIKMPVEPAYITAENLKIALDLAYTPAKTGAPPAAAAEKVRFASEDARKKEVRKLIDLILRQAVIECASFIHMEPSSDGLSVRLRIDGSLQRQNSIPISLSPIFIDTLKEIGHLNVGQRRTIQSGYFNAAFDGRETAFKISAFPVLVGYDFIREKITIKILNRDSGLTHLEDMGLYQAVLEKYREILKHKSGTVIISGPVDSGVTTTLYASLRRMVEGNLNIATIERTIDTFLDGVSQTQVDLQNGYTFRKGLNSVLVDDADVIMVSEIEDYETANLVFQAALNGRLVLTSMHALDSTSVYTILKEQGIEPLTLAMGLRGVLSQKLVRRICGECREAYHPPAEVLESLRLRPNSTLFRGRGCQACNFSGFKGRIGLFELFVPDETLINSLATGLPAEQARRIAIERGMHTIRMDGLRKALEGITTVEQVMAAAGKE